VAFEHAERDAEEDVESVKEQDIPYAEKRLNQKIPTEPHSISYYIFFTKGSTGHSDDEREREREGTVPRRADSR
jgi:hypothetical protein